MKKSILIFLTGLFLIGLFIGTASAMGGSGTESDPYTINSLSDLNLLSGNGYASYAGANKYFIITSNISGTFSGIGNQTYPFSGHLDGQNHTLSLTINNNFIPYLGGEMKNIIFNNCYGTGKALLITRISGLSTINNCHVINSYCLGNAFFFDVATPASVTESHRIENCSVENCIISSNGESSGASGFCSDIADSMYFSNCHVINTSIYSSNYGVSGFFGRVSLFYGRNKSITLEFHNCSVEKVTMISATSTFARQGGFFGEVYAGGNDNINLVCNDCHVKNSMLRVGYNEHSTKKACWFGACETNRLTATFLNCSVENSNFWYWGGSYSMLGNTSISAQISSINNTNLDLSAIMVRLLTNPSLTNDSPQTAPKNIGETVTFTINGQQGAAVYMSGNTVYSGYDIVYGTGGTMVGNNQLTASYSSVGSKNISINHLYGWNTISRVEINTSLTSIAYIDIPEKLNGSGTIDDPYQVESAEDWSSWSTYYSYYVDKYMSILQNFTPTTTVMEFNGNLNGNNHTLTNNRVPLFNSLGGTVTNLKFSKAIVTGNGLLANTSSAAVSNVTADDCMISGTTVGGLVGNATGSFTDCSMNHITVNGSTSAGGIAGAGNMTITRCHVLNSDILAPIAYGVCP